MFRKKRFLILIIWIVLFSPCVFAQEDISTRTVSLQEITDLALQNNFDIQLTKYDILISRFNVDIAESIYDTMLDAEASYSDDQSANNSTLLSDRTTTKEIKAGLSKIFPTGTEVSLDQTVQRVWSKDGFVTLNPAYDSTTALTVEQDLGRDFFGRQSRASVKIAVKDVQNTDLLSLLEIETTLAEVQKNYWNLVYLYEALTIRREILEQAKRLYDLDQERVQHGLVEVPQLFGSQANYQTRQAEMVLAQSALNTGMNLLKLSVNIEEDPVIITPADKTFQMPEHQVSLLDSMKKALEHRRDYLQALNEIERRDLLLEFARNNEWPEINLSGSFALNGIGSDFNDSINRISDENNPEFFASLAFSLPLENTEARAGKKQAELQKASALLNVKYLERKIAVQIKNQVTTTDAAFERLRYLREAAELQQKKALEQERIFRQGRSDSDTVIRFQEDALLARISVIRAFYDYYSALVELKRLEGTLLERYWDGEI
ncbi:MAG: TolC family protein [Candidatus Omnitrophota bacterium]